MSVYIPSMALPAEPGEHKIRLFVREDGTASIWGLEEYIPHEPLEVISVPDHGRLIDADDETFPTPHRNPSNDYMHGWNACLRSVQQQPTIIPASGGFEHLKAEAEVGEWIPLGHQIGYLKHPWSEDFKCPFCGYEQYTLLMEPPNRCPNCWASLKLKK